MSGNDSRWDSPAREGTAVDAHPVLTPLSAVSQREGQAALAARLFELQQWLGEDLSELEGKINAFVAAGTESEAETPHLAWRSAAHLLKVPGKRIRPMCVLLSARVGGLEMTPAVRDLAVACELVHAATLLHDDVIDEGTERRGAVTSRVVYGNSASILAGDQLFVEALQLVNGAGRPELMTELLAVIGEMIEAEAVQLERRGRFEPSREAYLHVIHGKTAALFRYGLAAGGRLAGLDEATIKTLGRVGTSLGMAFQLVDDVLDLAGDPNVTGKDAMADLRQGKLTWPFLLACEEDPELSTRIGEQVASGEGEADEAELARIVEAVQSSGAVEATRRFACEQGEEAGAELARLPEGDARAALELVVETAIHRAR